MFDYFGVLISIIFGLALTHVLRGLGRIIQMRHEIRPYWVHIVWTINVVIYVLSIWWSIYWWKGLGDWTFEWFLFITGYAIAIFMWAYVLFPAEFAPGVDFSAYFFSNRRWFFGLQVVVVLTDIPETLEKAVMHLRLVPVQYGYLVARLLLVSVVGLITDKRRIHAALCIVWLLMVLAYLFLSAGARIGARFA
jgi:hypothetical protein